MKNYRGKGLTKDLGIQDCCLQNLRDLLKVRHHPTPRSQLRREGQPPLRPPLGAPALDAMSQQHNADITTFAQKMEDNAAEGACAYGFQGDLKRWMCAYRLFSIWGLYCVENICKAQCCMPFSLLVKLKKKKNHSPHLSLLAHSGAIDSQLSTAIILLVYKFNSFQMRFHAARGSHKAPPEQGLCIIPRRADR